MTLANGVLWIRKSVIRYFLFPRVFRTKPLADEPDKASGRLNLPFAQGHYPFYVKPTIWNRWGPQAWMVWLLGGKLPGDNPEIYHPGGYLLEEVGPINRMNMGKEEMAEDAEKMLQRDRGGCPFR